MLLLCVAAIRQYLVIALKEKTFLSVCESGNFLIALK